MTSRAFLKLKRWSRREFLRFGAHTSKIWRNQNGGNENCYYIVSLIYHYHLSRCWAKLLLTNATESSVVSVPAYMYVIRFLGFSWSQQDTARLHINHFPLYNTIRSCISSMSPSPFIISPLSRSLSVFPFIPLSDFRPPTCGRQMIQAVCSFTNLCWLARWLIPEILKNDIPPEGYYSLIYSAEPQLKRVGDAINQSETIEGARCTDSGILLTP